MRPELKCERASVSAAQRQRATAIKMESNAHGAPNGGRADAKSTLSHGLSARLTGNGRPKRWRRRRRKRRARRRRPRRRHGGSAHDNHIILIRILYMRRAYGRLCSRHVFNFPPRESYALNIVQSCVRVCVCENLSPGRARASRCRLLSDIQTDAFVINALPNN